LKSPQKAQKKLKPLEEEEKNIIHDETEPSALVGMRILVTGRRISAEY